MNSASPSIDIARDYINLSLDPKNKALILDGLWLTSIAQDILDILNIQHLNEVKMIAVFPESENPKLYQLWSIINQVWYINTPYESLYISNFLQSLSSYIEDIQTDVSEKLLKKAIELDQDPIYENSINKLSSLVWRRY